MLNHYNLKLVKGIDTNIEKLLHTRDIWTLDDLSRTSTESLQQILNTGGNKYKSYDATNWSRLAGQILKDNN